jgi:methionine aminopeptidase
VPYLSWAKTVQDVVETEFGFKCIEHWGGHGYNHPKWDSEQKKQVRTLHGPPHLLNHRPVPAASWPEAQHTWKPGTLIAVEPMIAVATGETFQKPLGRMRDWPVFVAERGSDGRELSIEERLSVHYEHDVLITANGPDVLTKGLEEVNDVIAD